MVAPPAPSGVPTLAFGPSPGATIALGGGGTAQSDLGNSLLPLAFSPDGKTLAVGAGGSLALWNVATGDGSASSPVTPIEGIDSVAFSPDGKTLLVGGQSCLGQQATTGCAEVWNAATGTRVGAPVDVNGHLLLNNVAAAFSADGTTIVTAGSDGQIRLWSTATRHQAGPAFPAQHGGIEALAVSPRGGTLATAGEDGTVRLWNMATGAQAGRTLAAANGGGANAVTALAFSRDGSLLAGANENGAVQVWNVASGRPADPALPGGTDVDTGVAFSPDGTTVTSVNTDGTTRQWNLAALRGRPAAPPVPTGAGVTGDGMGNVTLGGASSLVTTDGDDSVSVWVSTGGTQQPSPVMTVANPPINPDDPTFAPRLALSPDGRRLVTGGDNGTIQLWDVSSPGFAGHLVKTIPVPDALTAAGGNISEAAGIEQLAFSADGRRFAAAYGSDDVQVFDAATGQPAGSSFTGGAGPGSLLALSFTPNGDLVTADMTGTVTTWNPRASDVDDFVTSTKLGLSGEPGAMAVTPDGQTLAAGFSDGTVQLWDIGTNQQVGSPVSTGGGNIDSLAFSPDGARLASAGDDGAVRLWDVSYLSAARDFARLRGQG
jgi:WD40 repeat protein